MHLIGWRNKMNQKTTPTSHPTLADVAAIAGVSVKTASRALNELDNVSTTTLEKVKKAADLVGYRSNRIARELRAGALSNLVGMIISDLSNPFYAGMASGVEEELTNSGLDLIIATARDDGDREKELIESLMERRVRGLIIIPSGYDYSYLHLERKRGFSFVFADRPPAFLDADVVLADNQGGISECVSYLVSRGCSRLALIADNTGIWTASERIQGFKKAVISHGLHAANSKVISGIHTSEQAEKVAEELINQNQAYDGVIATNDLIAIGVGHALTKSSNDVYLVSFDEFPTSKTMNIPTLNHDPKRIGKAAAKALLKRIENPTDTNFATHTIELILNQETSEVHN
jgi:LacI family transcriptional regulator